MISTETGEFFPSMKLYFENISNSYERVILSITRTIHSFATRKLKVFCMAYLISRNYTQ